MPRWRANKVLARSRHAPGQSGAHAFWMRLIPLRHLVTSTLLASAIVFQFVGLSGADEAFNQRVEEAARALALADSRVNSLDQAQRNKVASFILGNVTFVLFHELGHAVISELKLPVLGRQEDAADTFATLAMLNVGTEVSHQILEDAARGLYLIAEREKETGAPRPMYDEHGLDMQRAYQIVCLMVGSDRRAFKEIATRAKLPADRQESCEFDFDDARNAWAALLKSHAPSGSEPKITFVERLLQWRSPNRDNQSKAKVDYQEAAGPFAHYRSGLKAAGVLESVQDFVNKSISFPQPIALRARVCGEQNAYWDNRERELVLCYELVSEFVELGLRLNR